MAGINKNPHRMIHILFGDGLYVRKISSSSLRLNLYGLTVPRNRKVTTVQSFRTQCLEKRFSFFSAVSPLILGCPSADLNLRWTTPCQRSSYLAVDLIPAQDEWSQLLGGSDWNLIISFKIMQRICGIFWNPATFFNLVYWGAKLDPHYFWCSEYKVTNERPEFRSRFLMFFPWFYGL